MLYLIPRKKMYRDQIAHNKFLMNDKFYCQIKKKKRIQNQYENKATHCTNIKKWNGKDGQLEHKESGQRKWMMKRLEQCPLVFIVMKSMLMFVRTSLAKWRERRHNFTFDK